MAVADGLTNWECKGLRVFLNLRLCCKFREVSDIMFVAHSTSGSSPQSDINCTSIHVTKEMPYMGRISQRFMVVPLLNALVLANNLCPDSEDAALITVYNKSMNLRQANLATSWQSPRDLAIVPPPTYRGRGLYNIQCSSSLHFLFRFRQSSSFPSSHL